jgi:hypothetical protein
MCLLIIIIVSSCSSNKKNNADIDFVNDKNEVKPIDIKAPFFWMVRPWKEGKLVTLDGWGRYAEISFSGANKMAIKSLVEFPRVQQDGWGFMTWPESGVIASKSGKMDHIAAVDDNKTKSHVPLLTWVHNEPYVVLLDPDEGLIAYQYSLNRNDRDIGVSLFIYNYKTDTMVYETPDPGAPSPQKYNIDMQMAIDDRYMLSNSSTYHDGWRSDNFFYDWKKGEITRNDLTEYLNQTNSYVFNNCVQLDRRYLFIKVEEDEDNEKLLKIDWDAEYSNIQATDMSSLFQEIYKKSYSISELDLIISSDGSWVTTTITDFSEYNPDDTNNRFITTRVFFHIDNKYPNGISIPIFSDGDERSGNTKHDEGAFVRHPVYGMCYAQEWRSEEKIYLRLYKMDDVLTAINSGSQSLPFYHLTTY